MNRFLLSTLAFFVCNAIYGQVVVLSEDFSGIANGQTGNSFNLSGWNQTRDTDVNFTDGWAVDDGGAWLRDGFNNNGTTGAIRLNMTNNVKRDFLISPTVDLSATPSTGTGSYTVSWDMAFASNNNGNTFQALNDGDEVHLVISTDGGSTFTSLMSYDSASTIMDGGETFSVELDSSFFSSTVVFAFWGFEGNVTTLATNVFVDNFEVVETATLSINETFNKEISIYPTLTSDNLYVDNHELQVVDIFTLTGKIVPVQFSDSTIYTNLLNAGIYFIQLTDVEGNTSTSKFIKK